MTTVERVENAHREDLMMARACSAGDRNARRQIFREHYPHLTRFFGNKVPPDQVEDLVSDTFLRLFDRGLANYAGEGRLRSFILGVAYRRLLEHYRKDVRLTTLAESDEHAPPDRRPSPSRVNAQRERKEVLRSALRALSTDSQTILELYYWNQTTTGEIAVIMQRPVGTVRSQLDRARELLKKNLRQAGFDASEWLELSSARSAPRRE